MRNSRMVLAVASAVPLVVLSWFEPAFAQTADSANAPVKELGMVTINGGHPTQIPTTTDVRVRYQISKQVSAAVGIDNLNSYQLWNFHPYPQRTCVAALKWAL
jgi:outer membrane receptor protein involved in Fe transport